MTQATANPAATELGASQCCEACGYDLRGQVELRCPECGRAFRPTARPAADIPWLRRRAIGNLAGYWGTVWLVLRHPAKLAAEAWRDVTVDAAEATRFRRLTVFLVALAVTVPTALALALASGATAMVFAVPLGAATCLFLELATWFKDLSLVRSVDGHRERFERLHDFTCAPLALSPAAPLLWWPGVLLDIRALQLAAVALVPVLGLAWTVSTLRFHRRGGDLERGGVFVHGFVLWLFWSLSAGFSIVVVAAATALTAALLAFGMR